MTTFPGLASQYGSARDPSDCVVRNALRASERKDDVFSGKVDQIT
jgi:hypothetical protein